MLPQKVDIVLSTINNLQPIPSSVTRILKEIDNPYTSVTTISEYIGLDQALTAMVLKTSNSVLLGYKEKCSSITDAVMRIGFKLLKAILFAQFSVGPMTGKLNGYRLGNDQLWVHSLKIAMISEWLARNLRYDDPEEAYIAGLLHDMGKLLLDQFVLEDYQNIVRHVKQYHMPVWQAEEIHIGIDHAKLGGVMASRWNFATSLIEGIQYHHIPSAAKLNQKLPAIVNLAHIMVIQNNDDENELLRVDLHPDTVKILNIHLKDLDQLSKGVNDFLSKKIES